MHQLDIEFPQDLDQDLVHLKQCQIATDTQMTSATELFLVSGCRNALSGGAYIVQVASHQFVVAFEPSLRTKVLDVVSENGLVAM